MATDELRQADHLQRSRQTSPRARARLIWAFAIRDLRARFTATSLGLLWTMIVPIATVIIYSTVFSVIFRAQAPPMGNGNQGVFAAWFFVGLVVWNIFSQVTVGGMGSILGMGPMLQKVFIPSYVPVLASSVTIAVEKLIETSVMLLVLLAFQNVGWTWLLFPFVIVVLWVFASAFSYCLAVAIVHFRDTGQIVGIVMQLWFFLTPVMYPVDMIPEDWKGLPLRSLLALNPMADFVEIGRLLLYDLSLPPLGPVLYCLAWTAALVGAAVIVYRRWGRDVGGGDMTDYAIEAVGLSKKFLMATERRTSLKERLVRGKSPAPKTFWALKDATFSVPKGSSLGIIGHNGSGKSTALKVLTGIYRPTSGTVKVSGSVSALLEVGAGFHGELTGRENIRLNATILGFTNREIDRFMDQIIEFADIGEHIDAPLKHYSSGMYVRLGFAVAVMVRPEVLIVDEVIAVGDESFQRKCFDYLYGLRRGGTSLIVVSHGLSQINDLCDDTLWLDRGVLQMLGPSRRVTQAYVDSVNAQEADRAHAPEPLGAGDSTAHHRGTGAIRVTGVEFLRENGTQATLVSTGDHLVVRLSYVSTTDVSDVTFTLSAANAEGLPILVLGSSEISPWEIAPGTGEVHVRMDPCLLAPGTYAVKSSVTAASSILDADDVGVPLTIRPGGPVVGGMYRQPCEWSLVPAGESRNIAM